MAGDASENERDERSRRRLPRQGAWSHQPSRDVSPEALGRSQPPLSVSHREHSPSKAPPTTAEAKQTGDIFRRIVSGRARLEAEAKRKAAEAGASDLEDLTADQASCKAKVDDLSVYHAGVIAADCED